MHNYEIIFMAENMICSLGATIIKILPESLFFILFNPDRQSSDAHYYE